MSGFESIPFEPLETLKTLRPKSETPQFIGDDERRSVRASKSDGAEFQRTLVEALGSIQGMQSEAKAKVEALARGENVELHDLFIASGKSDVAFNMMLEVRNKLLEAWQTITRSAV